jgi:arsenite methyltransferase
MAELKTIEPTRASGCCGTEGQATSSEPAAKEECCGTVTESGDCGCDASQLTEADDIRETVRAKYAAAARQAADAGSWGCEAGFDPADTGAQTFGVTLYGQEGEQAPQEAVNASLGCGVPTAVADLHAGETVLDLGSGAGADVFISAPRVGPSGKAIGLDMTDEMLELARANAANAGASNVEFLKGYLEDIPLPDGSVDVVISNCVINLAADKRRVLAEAARVLRPGGRFAVSDVIADADMDAATRGRHGSVHRLHRRRADRRRIPRRAHRGRPDRYRDP